MTDELTTDVAIIGAGVAGALIADHLARQGIGSIVLEAGPRLFRDEVFARQQETWKQDNSAPYPNTPLAPRSDPSDPDDNYVLSTGPYPYRPHYLRGVGGTTWHWQGVSFRYVPSDFELRSRYGVGTDWPLSYGELEADYDQAERELGVSCDDAHDWGSPRSSGYPMQSVAPSYADTKLAEAASKAGFNFVPRPGARNSIPYDGRPACHGHHNCSNICPIGAQYSGNIHVERAEKNGARVMENSLVTAIEIDHSNEITRVRVRREDGSEFTVTARIFVAAANALETPRLFLMSANEKLPAGIANTSGMVGVNLMDHVASEVRMDVAEPVFGGRGPLSGFGEPSWRDGEERRRRSGYILAFENVDVVSEVTNEALLEGKLGVELDNAIRERTVRRVILHQIHEHLPDPQNRVSINYEQRDSAGLPKITVRFAIDDYALRGQEEATQRSMTIAETLGATNTRFVGPYSGFHPVGTLAMGADRLTSVTDADGRTHDHPNLFVAGSATFPSSGTANPTLTVAALALRTARAISTQLV